MTEEAKPPAWAAKTMTAADLAYFCLNHITFSQAFCEVEYLAGQLAEELGLSDLRHSKHSWAGTVLRKALSGGKFRNDLRPVSPRQCSYLIILKRIDHVARNRLLNVVQHGVGPRLRLPCLPGVRPCIDK